MAVVNASPKRRKLFHSWVIVLFLCPLLLQIEDRLRENLADLRFLVCQSCAKTETNKCIICLNTVLGTGVTENAIYDDDKQRNSMDRALKFPCINIK